MFQNSCKTDPGEIYDILTGYWKTGILKAAIELSIFTEIFSGNNTSDKVASSLGVKERGISILMDALCGMKLVGKEKGIYTLSTVAENYLVSTKASYIGDAAKSFVPMEDWEVMGMSGEAIKMGGPIKEGPREVQFWDDVVTGLIPFGAPIAKIICDLLKIDEGTRKGYKVLDLACGSGIYGYTILQRDPSATVTDLDLENVLRIAKKIALDMGVADRITHQPGDIITSDYGDNLFDIAIISHILQSFAPDTIRIILDKVYRALAPGGTLVIHEFVPDEERATKSFPLLFAAYMFSVTPEGRTYTFSEFSRWLKEAGFSHAVLHDLPGSTSLIIGYKPEK